MWELYDVEHDWTQSRDVAAEHPEILARLQRLFLVQAARFNVLPMDVRSAERFNNEIAGRPALITGTSQTLYSGMRRLSENSVVNTKNKSFSLTASITVPDEGADGVIVVQGGAFGGWSLYTAGSVLKFTYNLLGVQQMTVTADAPLAPGQQEVSAHFAYDGGGLGKGGTVTLRAGDADIGEGQLSATIPFMYSMDETVDLGRDTASPVSSEYTATGNSFTGSIAWVRIDLGDDDHGHLVDPQQKLDAAMLRQ